MRRLAYLLLVILVLLSGLPLQAANPISERALGKMVASSAAPGTVRSPTPDDPPSMPPSAALLFIENVGQYGPSGGMGGARFQMWGGVGTTWLAEDAIWITLVEAMTQTPRSDDGTRMDGPRTARRRGTPADRAAVPRGAVNLKLSFVGANPHPTLAAYGRATSKVSYYIGADARQWHADVPVWSGVRYVDLYPGIDLVLGADDGRAADRWTPSTALPWRLEVGREAAPGDVRLRIEGAEAVTVKDGELQVRTAVGEVRLPLAYLGGEASSPEKSREGAHGGEDVVQPAQPAGAEAFEVQTPFTRQRPARAELPDHPSDLRYATFLGGREWDQGNGIAVDGAGCAYVTGSTETADFPASRGPGFDTSFNGWKDAYVLKLGASGATLAYATFLGGGTDDWGSGIAVDGEGRAYVTGYTGSADFPAALGPGYDTSYNGHDNFTGDAYVVKLSADGTALAYATFLGGSAADNGSAIAVDDQGCAYVTGDTQSADFPAAVGPGYDTRYNGGVDVVSGDAYVVKLNASGTALVYATFLGGIYGDWGLGIAVDGAGCAFVTGDTQSAEFPAALGPGYDRSYNWGDSDAYALKLSHDGTALLYATFLGGSKRDRGLGIAADGAGCAYVTGYTESADFPAALGPGYDTSYSGTDVAGDAYVVKLDASGMALVYATFLGDSESDSGDGIAVDTAGCAYITGETGSIRFPAAHGLGYDTSYNGGIEAYLVKLSANGLALAYATFVGGGGNDQGYGIAVDGARCAYLTGQTTSADFPAAQGPGYDSSYHGSVDAYAVKLATVKTVYLPLVQRARP